MAKAKVVEISPIRKSTVEFEIVGISPLIVHCWDEKMKRKMLEKQMKAANKTKCEAKVPVNDFINSLYWLTPKPEDASSDEVAWQNFENAVNDGAVFGFPLSGIKQSIIMGAWRAGLDVKTSELRGCMFLNGTANGSTPDFAAIVADPPSMREDMVRLGGISNPADIRYRAEFANWRIPLKMTYDEGSKYSLDQLINCINYGGMYCGIGEWRPEKDGQFGMYELRA